MRFSQFAEMLRFTLIALALGLIVCVSTAPEIFRSVEEKKEVSEVTTAGHQVPKEIQGAGDHFKDKETESAPVVSVGDGKDSGQVNVFEDGEKDLANRGLVSDIINATISGVQFGIGLGTTNGTLDRLCIKIGGITMAGCRRTAGLDLGRSKATNGDAETDTTKM